MSAPATYQDVIDAPPHMVAEIAGGVLHLQPRPAPRHAFASSVLGAELGPFARDGGWIILDEPELHLGTDVLVPDLAGWRVERMPGLPETAYFETPPDWVCEVLSPSTRRFDLVEKRALYAAAGVGFLWLVDPAARTLEAFGRLDAGWLLLGAAEGDDTPAFPPFGGVVLSRLWAPGEKS